MKFTVVLSRLPHLSGDVGRLSSWKKEIGEAVQAGEAVAVVGGEIVLSPAFGILVKKFVLPGEAVEIGEPVALLSGIPETFVTGDEAIPEPVAIRPPYVPGGPETVLPLSTGQRALQRHMARSLQESPHVYTVQRVDMSEVLRLSSRGPFDVLPFLIGATASALRQFPEFNAERIGETAVRHKEYVHIAVPIRRDDSTIAIPILRDADRKSIAVLAREWDELREAAQQGTLSTLQQRGATFTLSQTDALYQTPILHQPQSAILCVGAVERVPVAAGDFDVAVRPLCHLCLAHDARIAANEAAADFLAAIRQSLEEARFLFA
jgi:pyruvate/2-oxoglutarate dehydrogenase complex dihydrolipoamide acyltransferase (E2) component